MTDQELRFLGESNHIEDERSEEAFAAAIYAWEHAMLVKSAKTLEIEDILSIHRILMERLNPKIAGKIRKRDVWVGGRKCPPPEHVEAMLEEWIEKWKEPKTAEECKQAHIEFEKIHPFEDGNGRTGRIIYNIHRLNAGLPIDVIEEGKKYAYYKWFN